MMSKYYTYNVDFLLDTQYFIKNYKFENNISDYNIKINDIQDILLEVKNETGLYEKYKYIESPYFEFLNRNAHFLQSLTIYNLFSPIFSISLPIIMLIIPFFLIKMKHQKVTLEQYIDCLKFVIKHHFIGKSILEFSTAGIDRKFFTIFSIVFYFINIYQNFISCYKFYNNFFKIKNVLTNVNNFIQYSIKSIENINIYCKNSYINFKNKNNEIKNILIEFKNNIQKSDLSSITILQINKIGEMLFNFYQLFQNKSYFDSIYYCIYLELYIKNITKIQYHIKNKQIAFFID